jgi:hypothetical protein
MINLLNLILLLLILLPLNVFALEFIEIKEDKEIYLDNEKYDKTLIGWYKKTYNRPKIKLIEKEQELNINKNQYVTKNIETETKKDGVKDEIAFHVNILTMHFSNPEDICSKYENKVSKNGCNINNPLYGISFRETINGAYRQNSFFFGQDSIGSNIVGYMNTMGMASDWGLELGLTFGFYFMSKKPWEAKGIQTPSLSVGSDYSLIPVAGIQGDFRIPVGNSLFIKLNNLITPTISNHNVSIGWSY